jgi:hypothetical protein
MSLKPIEPGCLAMTFGMKIAENDNKVVTVVEKIPHPCGFFLESDYWEVDQPILTRRRNNLTGEVLRSGIVYFVPEKCLMRIDGHEVDEFDAADHLSAPKSPVRA